MTIQIGGHTYTQAEVIAAIAASDNAEHTHTVSAYSSLDEVSGVLQSVLHRLAALEDRLPITHAGFGVLKTTEDNVDTFRVQATDHHGDTVIFTFEYPSSS